MIGFSSKVEGYTVLNATPSGGDHVAIAYMFKPATGLEDVLWVVASVVQDEHGYWRINYMHEATIDDDEALKTYCELTGFVPGETS